MKRFDVFISYQRADTLYVAHALGYALRLAGHDAFVDTGGIGGGELYPQAISQAISRANVVLALIGPKFDVKKLHEPYLGREHSSDRSSTAESASLVHPSVKNAGPPVIVYAGTWAVAQRDELIRIGASDVMANREQLINTVLRMLGRAPEEPPRDSMR